MLLYQRQMSLICLHYNPFIQTSEDFGLVWLCGSEGNSTADRDSDPMFCFVCVLMWIRCLLVLTLSPQGREGWEP